jgi:hypothetical protein
MAFDLRGGVEAVAVADQLVVAGSGATTKDETQRSFSIVIPVAAPINE